MKHGPVALIDEKMPVVVFIATKGELHDFKPRLEPRAGPRPRRPGHRDRLEGRRRDRGKANEVIHIEDLGEYLTSRSSPSFPSSSLAYHIATLKGTDVDQPRNLAKSVTVE
ncbi:MAG: hypothetical protein IPK00_24525 [Deltaproteobacteria bacterium]|nr:hypothetical protein [Deltaproteobacteria bacterium]